MPKLQGISPIVPVFDVARTVEFYRDCLNFEVRNQMPDGSFALVAREAAGISLIKADDLQALEATKTNISAYIWVEDLAALWDELGPKLMPLGEDRVRPPFTQEYGMHEFHVKDPDGFLIFFGEDATDEGAS